MNRIEAQVRNARRRLILGKFGRALSVTLFAALIVATVACAIPGISPMDVEIRAWNLGWIIGSIAAAIVGSLIYAVSTAPTTERVALEVDKRFGLAERLSSSMSMLPSDRESDFGLAVMDDAARRADKIRISDQFGLQPNRLGWLPLATIPILAVVLLLVDPASSRIAEEKTEIDPAVAAQVKRASLQLKKRIEAQRRKADAKGLKDAKELFEKLEKDLNKIAEKKNVDRKEAMIALNNLKQQLEDRRKELGSNDQFRKAISQMKSVQAGPATEAAKSISKGDFGKAEQVMRKLAQKMRDGNLSEKEKQQLKNQVEQLKKQLEQSINEQKKKQQELQEKIEQAKREGRSNEAAKMQQQLNQMKQQSQQQMQGMQQMADKLGQAAQAMQNGDSQQAADSLQDMADQLGDMQQDMSELKDLEDAMNDLSQSKEQMRCKSCNGGGCQQCQGMGMGNGMGDKPGNGLGEGAGQGDRPEEEGDTNSYETQVRGEVKKGRAVITGFADGPNRKGVTRESLKAVIENSLSEESDPLENQQLPRTEREHAMDYFNKLRGDQ